MREAPRSRAAREVARLAALATALLGVAACGSASHASAAPDDVPEDHDASAIDGGFGGGSGGGEPAGCEYGGPERTWSAGEVLPDDMTWKGLDGATSQPRDVRLGDWHDPDGSLGINAIYISQANAECAACWAEAGVLRPRLAPGGTWSKLGVRFLQLLWEPCDGDPLLTTLQWKTRFQASWPVAYDPRLTIGVLGQNQLPEHLLVDPRTMKVIARISGFDSSNPETPAVEALAKKNQK